MGFFLILVSAWKWLILLKAKGKESSIIRMFHLYLVGYFFNHFFPSNVGGDIVRAYEVGREIDDKAIGFASVFMERFTGLTALLVLSVISFLSNLRIFGDVRFAIALGSIFFGYGFIFAMIANNRPLIYIKSRFKMHFLITLATKLLKLQEAIKSYSKQKKALYISIGISFIYYLLAVLNVYFATLAFGMPVSVKSLIVILPVILAISMMPVSIGGIGVQEWAYFFTFSAIGAGGSLGLLVALVMRFKGILTGLIGGVLYSIKGTGKQTKVEILRNGEKAA
jgi:glycosyltransferase 2 family protein